MLPNYLFAGNLHYKSGNFFSFSSKNSVKEFKKYFSDKGTNLLRSERPSINLLQMNQENSTEQIPWINSILENSEKPNFKELEYWRKISRNLIKNTPAPSKKDESWRLYSLENLYNMEFSAPKIEEIKPFFREELEKITGLKVVFIDGQFSHELSDIQSMPEGVFFGSVSEMDNEKISEIKEKLGKGESGIDGGYFSLLNLASISDINVLDISEKTNLKEPVNLVFLNNSVKNSTITNNRIIISAGKDSNLKLYKTYISSPEAKFFDNSCISLFLDVNASLNFTLVNNLPSGSCLIKSIYADLKERANFDVSAISLGGSICRTNVGIEMNGINSSCNLQGLGVAKEKNISDIHSRISHNFPNCFSKQLQKNLVFNSAQTVFAGKVQVQNGAFNTNSEQLCKTLLLSEKARVDAIPILEINNEDVKCTHGATVSDLDESQVFYIESRGINKETAKKVLIKGFADEIVTNTPASLNQRVSEKVVSFLEDI